MMREIEIKNLLISKFNVRKEVGDIDELADSIKQVGILEPLLVRSSTRNTFEIIIGQRRYHAARKAGLKKVPCIVKEMSDEEAILASLIENIQRGDITEEEVAKSFLTLRERSKTNWTQKEFSKRIGKSQPWLSGILTAYQTLIKLKTLGIVKGMKSYPSKEDREKGIVPVEHLKEIQYALRSKKVRNALNKSEIGYKRVELAKAILDLPIEKGKRIINTFKKNPRKPVTEMKVETSGGTTERREYPRTKTNTFEEFSHEKSTSDPFVIDFKKYLLTIEDAAKYSVTKIPAYVEEVISRLDPELFRKINLLTDDLDQLVLDAVSQKTAYFECVKIAVVREEKIPEFKGFIHDILENWLKTTIALKNCSKAKPGFASDRCGCGSTLEYNKNSDVFCPSCRGVGGLICPICEGKLLFNPPISLVCGTCLYRLKFVRKISPEVTLEYACYCALNDIKDPRLKGKKLVVFHKEPDDSKKVLKVAASW